MAEPDAGQGRPPSIVVEVVFCADRSTIDRTTLSLPAGASVEDALQASGVLQRFADVAPHGSVGIWGRAVRLAQQLRDGDRVELYRPLVIDPMDARRLRQRHQARVRRG